MNSTIAAISTGITESGIIIVRLSGPEAICIADKIYRSKKGKIVSRETLSDPRVQGKRYVNVVKTGKKLQNQPSGTIHYGFINDGEKDIDEVLVSIFKAPKTYTGEDIAEINCHGGILVSKKILELVIESGAVIAEPGEFTKRAFMNGKMDLTRAEAAISVIEAKNDFALKAAVSQLKGSVYRKVSDLRNRILDEVSFIEAALDDPEHYDLLDYGLSLKEKLVPIKKEIVDFIKKSDDGSVLTAGIKTVIAGKPNAGKSSLLNILAGYEKAIVTDIAGTTRDVLEVNVRLGEVSLLLMDTAGIRNTDNEIEKIGVDRAKAVLKNADLVLYVIDSSEGISKEDRENIESVKNIPTVILLNKSDLIEDNSTVKEEAESLLGKDIICISTKTLEGTELLEEKIKELFNFSEIQYNDQVIITNARQKKLLIETEEAIQNVFSGIDMGMSEEFLTVDLMKAYVSLGNIIGEELGDDVADRIFSKYCMGK